MREFFIKYGKKIYKDRCFETNCKSCKKLILKEIHFKKWDNHFCNMECYNEYKIKNNTFEGKQRKAGWKHTEESIKRISDEQSGENHYGWKGGISQDRKHKRGCLNEWRKNNPLKSKTHSNKRRLLTSDLIYKTVQLVYEENIKKYGTLTCYLCELSIEFGKDSLEHKVPLSRGGTNEYRNLGVAHRSCNSRKNNKTEQEFREKESKN